MPYLPIKREKQWKLNLTKRKMGDTAYGFRFYVGKEKTEKIGM